MKLLHKHGLGGLLADEMGLGKTIQVIALMGYLHECGELRPSLIVQPLATIDNWHAEIQRCYPGLRVLRHQGIGRIRDKEWLSQWDVVLTTYDTLVRDELVMGRIDWQLVVCDEAQMIKNYTARRTDSAKALKARCRVALSGTPVENSLGELWSIMDFAQPGLLGSYQEFRKEFEQPLVEAIRKGDDGARREAERGILRNIAHVYRRRTKKEHLPSLPPLHEHVLPVPFGPEQKRLYLEMIAAFREEKDASTGRLFSLIHRLVQVCSHPGLVSPQLRFLSPGQVPKLAQTLDILQAVRERGEKVLIYAHYREMQDILRAHCHQAFDLPSIWIINGDTPYRHEIVQRFNERPGFDVLILSPRAAGVGLNIIGANHVIHFTRWWNPALERQATDRVHRIGQTRPVHVYYPVVEEPGMVTIEQFLADKIAFKLRLAESALIPSSQLTITPEEIAEGLRLSV